MNLKRAREIAAETEAGERQFDAWAGARRRGLTLAAIIAFCPPLAYFAQSAAPYGLPELFGLGLVAVPVLVNLACRLWERGWKRRQGLLSEEGLVLAALRKLPEAPAEVERHLERALTSFQNIGRMAESENWGPGVASVRQLHHRAALQVRRLVEWAGWFASAAPTVERLAPETGAEIRRDYDRALLAFGEAVDTLARAETALAAAFVSSQGAASPVEAGQEHLRETTATLDALTEVLRASGEREAPQVLRRGR